jgi:DNA repair protein RecO (recombination protein O)
VSERIADETVWVLHRRPWQETSLLVELLTARHGRIAALARGARRLRARTRPEPFRPLLAAWSLARPGGLATLLGLEPAGDPVRLSGDALWSAFYLNEVLLRLLPRGVPQDGVHDLYASGLGELSALGVFGRGAAVRAAVRRFEKRLLDTLGYGPDFRRPTSGGEGVDPERRYRVWTDDHGTVRVDAAEEGIPGAVLLGLAEERFEDPDVLALADRLLPFSLAAHTGPLERSRRVYTAVRALVPARASSPVPSESSDAPSP